MNLSQELDVFIESIKEEPIEKKYWLIRTQSGSLYDTFRENSIIAIQHDEVSLSFIYECRQKFGNDASQIQTAIRNKVKLSYETNPNNESPNSTDPRKFGLIASQIYKFVFELKKGDIVIIPSEGSEWVSFGIVMENFIGEYTKEQISNFGVETVLIRKVKWNKDLQRTKLDPYLFRAFTAHQAINDICGYADIIERSLKDFFILKNEAHLIINIEAEGNIPAADIFGLGSEILQLIDEFSDIYSLGVSSNDLQVTINLNSPGKIDLKSKIKKTTVVAGLILAVFGGGYRSKNGSTLETRGLPGLIKAVDEFANHHQDRQMKKQVFEKYKDSLDIKDQYDIVYLLKQFSENKDSAR